MTRDVKISIQNRIEGAHHLAESRMWVAVLAVMYVAGLLLPMVLT